MLDIKKEKENAVLERREIVATVAHEGKPTPSMADVERALAKQFDCDAANVEVTKIFSGRGSASSEVRANIWKGAKPAPRVKVKKAEDAKK